jgi:hypothetical protein
LAVLPCFTCTFREVPLAKSRRSHVEVWVNELSTNLAPGTVKTRFSNRRAVLRAPIRDRMISSDPSDSVQRPDSAAERPPWRFTSEQVKALLEAASDDFRCWAVVR